MFDNDFSMSLPSRRLDEFADVGMADRPNPDISRPSSPFDEGYCSSQSTTQLSMAELSQRFNQQNLQSRELPPHLDTSSSRAARTSASPARGRRSSSPQNYFRFVRQQRQLAARYQCTPAHLSQITTLAERILQDGDSSDSDSYNISRNGQSVSHLSVPSSINTSPSILGHEASSSCSSPLSPPSPAYDDDSDPTSAWSMDQKLVHASQLQALYGAPIPKRYHAVEKTVRMRKRTGGRTRPQQ